MKTYMVKTLAMFFILVFLQPLQVSAENTGLRVDGEGKVTLPSREAAEEGMSALSFSFFVDAPGAGDILFQFDGSDARIQEFRYDKETNKLNVYIAGTEAAIWESGELMEIGRIVVLDGNGNDKGTAATVHVAAGSLKYVCGTELKWMKDLETSGEMQMVSAGVVSTPTPTVPPTPVPGTPVPATPTPAPTPTVPTPIPIGPTSTPEEPASTSTPYPDQDSQPGSDDQGQGTSKPVQTPGQPVRPAQTSSPGQTTRPGSAAGPGQTARPTPEASPSATPQVSGSQGAEDDPGSSDKDVITLPAVNDGSGKADYNSEDSGQKMDWVLAAAVIAIALFVIVAIMAIVVLKGNPGRRGFEEDDHI